MKVRDLVQVIFALAILVGLGFMIYSDWKKFLLATGILLGVILLIIIIQESIPFWKRLMDKKIF